MGPESTQSSTPPGAPEPQRRPVGADTGDASLAEAVATVRKRLWILILAAVLGVIYGAYKAVTQPKLFTATSTVQVHNGSANAYRLENANYYDSDSLTKMNTEVTILQSDTMLTTVARDMNLANNADFLGATGPLPPMSIDDPNVRANVIGVMRGSLQVVLVPRTQLMRISYSSLNAKLSADIVNQLVSAYIQRSFQTPEKQTKMVSDWLSGQLDNLKHEVELSQQQMMDLQRQLGVLGYDAGNHNELQASLEELLAAENNAKVQRITAESRYRMVKDMDANTIESSIETTPGTQPGELNSLRAQIANDQAQYAHLTANTPGGLGPKNPTAVALKTRIDELNRELLNEQNRIVTQAREHYLAAKAAEDSTHNELEARKEEAYRQGDEKVRLSILQREYEQNRALYDGLQQRLETAKVEAGLDALEVDTVDEAVPPVAPNLRPAGYIIGTTTLFFVLGGIVVAFIVEALDTRIHGVPQIEAVMQMPSLALIPRSKRSGGEPAAGTTAAQRNINVLTQPKSQFAESFRSLQTSLMLSTAGQPPKFILFTSATPSEGKTTTATNLAAVLAQGDARVLLIDADMRRPSIHHRFGLTGKTGLSTVLAGTSRLQDTIQHIPELPNLDILPSGPVPPFPTDMLGSDAMRRLLESFAESYAYVVIDSPPILSVTDAVILGRMVDAVVLVVRHGQANKNVMRRTRDLLSRSGAPLAGLVLNAVDLNSPEYYGYYGYSGYSYGSMDAGSWDTQSTAKNDTKPGGNGRS
ncbi:MAG TPA: polysaccharide biosynthesis tyrosine autokinase [Acidobacteriaceae bacterium]|nr:polysaccharide biosynthesis tyrosine autokinase [Acidobacteriaceae bacterium]